MASPISCLSILVIPLLVTSLFYHVSNADQALIESVCEKSTNNVSCLSDFRSDPRSSTADLYTLGIVSVDLNLKVFEEADSQIPNLLASLTDSLDRSRLLNCQTNLTNAHKTMITVKNLAEAKSYTEEDKTLWNAYANIQHCTDEYKVPPIRQSPISNLTSKMEDLITISSNIIAIIDSL